MAVSRVVAANYGRVALALEIAGDRIVEYFIFREIVVVDLHIALDFADFCEALARIVAGEIAGDFGTVIAAYNGVRPLAAVHNADITTNDDGDWFSATREKIAHSTPAH